MKRTMFNLLLAAAIASPAAAAETQARSVGAHPVVYDDYPESDVVIDVGPDIVLTVTGEARTRFEWIENTTDFSSNGRETDGDDIEFDDSFSYAPARFNIGFRVDLPRDVAAVIELQGNFEMGGGPAGFGTELRAQTTQHQRPGVINHVFGPPKVGNGNQILGADADPRRLEIVRVLNDIDGDGVFVYQGYIETAHVGDSIFSMRFGRQELAYGTEWLLGNQDWYDGQTFDAVKGIFEFTDKHRLDIFWAKIAERDTTLATTDGGYPLLHQGGDDADLYGAYFSAQTLGGSSVGMDAYLLALRDQANIGYNVDTDADGDVITSAFLFTDAGLTYLQSYWAGVRFFRERETGFHFSAEATYQWGSLEGVSNGDDDGFDITAWGFEGFLGYTWDTPSHPTIKGGVTYATGSTAHDLGSGDYNTFFTPAGEVHPRLGLADIIEASNVLAFNLGYTGSHERHSWGVDLWHFEEAEPDPLVESSYVPDAAIEAGHDFGDEMGQEVDLWYNYQYSEHMVAQFAVAYFNAGSFIEDANRCGTPDGTCDPTDPSDADSIGTSDAWRVYANLLVRF
jgi:hypothetical protein